MPQPFQRIIRGFPSGSSPSGRSGVTSGNSEEWKAYLQNLQRLGRIWKMPPYHGETDLATAYASVPLQGAEPD